jgi:curli biogenesis system outer membrane secretion channel CsgG
VAISSLFKISPLLAILGVAGCSFPEHIRTERMAEGEVPVLQGAPVRNSSTPFDPVLRCYGRDLQSRNRVEGIAVGNIRDYTGKQEPDAGFVITQGGSLMAYSALGKMRGGVRIHERFDTQVAESELTWINNRQLGDGRQHTVDSNGGEESVPWLPYFGGSIIQSDYFIVGGITEVNYNIQSGGAEATVNNIGPRARTYTMNIAVDLRIVGSQTLRVYDTVTVEKQITGVEVGAGIFRFFGSDLYDINIGAKVQEPIQFAVRMAIESGVLQLLPSVTKVPYEPCLMGDDAIIAADFIADSSKFK